jgi:hypothetical protein
MNIKEIEQKIQKISNSVLIQKIRLSYKESDELDEFYIDVWLENISKFLANDRKINTEFDVCKEVAKEIIEFAKYSERTYAAALYDFVRYFLLNNLNSYQFSTWFKVTKYFDNIAIEVDKDWSRILDVLDDFTLSELEEFLERGFELISHPTYDTLIGINISENRFLEMQYIISVGLFILYENHSKIDGVESFLEQSIEKRNDRNYVIEALRKNGLIFKHIETKFQTDEELALIAIEQDSDVVVEEMLPMDLIEDGDFIEKVIRIKPLLITYLLGNKDYHILIHKKLLFIAIEESGVDALWEMDSEIFKDIDIIVAALKSPYGQDCWDPILCGAGENAEYSKKIIEAGYNLYGDKVLALNYSNLTNDRQVVELVISIDGHLFNFVNQEFKMDKSIIEKAILNDADSFRFIPESLKDDRSFVLELGSINGNIFPKLSNDLKNDKEIVRHAMLQDFDNLEYASDRLRNDKEFIFSVLNENIKLQNENKKIMDSILKDFEETHEKKYDDEYWVQRDKLYKELSKKYTFWNCGILHGVSDVLKSDKEFVLDILKIDPWSVRSLSETLKLHKNVMQIVFVSEPYLLKLYYSDKTMDRDFAIDAININPKLLEYLDNSFRNDFEIMKLAVSKNGELLKLASDELKNNRKIVSLAVRNSPSALGFASNDLKKNEEFLGLFYDFMATVDPYTFLNYEVSLELFMILPENKQKNTQLLLCFARGIWYYEDLYLSKYKSIIMKYHSKDLEFIKQCMILEEYDFSFLTLIDYNSVKENEELMIAAIQADIRNAREPIIWGGDDLINNVNYLNKVLAIAPQYLAAIKSNKNISEYVKIKLQG